MSPTPTIPAPQAEEKKPEQQQQQPVKREVKPEDKRKEPNPKCKHCFGRGHLGKNRINGLFIPCSCIYSDNEMTRHKQERRDAELYRRMHQRR